MVYRDWVSHSGWVMHWCGESAFAPDLALTVRHVKEIIPESSPVFMVT